MTPYDQDADEHEPFNGKSSHRSSAVSLYLTANSSLTENRNERLSLVAADLEPELIRYEERNGDEHVNDAGTSASSEMHFCSMQLHVLLAVVLVVFIFLILVLTILIIVSRLNSENDDCDEEGTKKVL
ncbi:hypothetical protein VCUG_01825 [Vavraia culicis subsp. floridensis]|uniref:Uncharacterized protein n=1 Tax=Vavraia culicis (isolate floridensis) TaxID=948595 RepID=L2GU89_VAVCU|nr:uncharacterized protein VCUG_01825 [Vavraia culicis subsp. floridensis]ELA46675.1 hypothetical protein VCUG_01825 [Vavraia culicis subsp. floridensis]